MKCLIVIPARMGSTRFPGKPLVDLLGKTMVQRVYEAAVASGVGSEVVVATPDQEIVDACAGFGAQAILTSHSHITGTDRIAEVAQAMPAEVYVNVQGDEPLIQPISIKNCADPMLVDSSIQMGSAYCLCPAEDEENPAAVKVVTDGDDFALYFSRFPIPYPRNPRSIPIKKHLGLYAYRREPLMAFSKWQPSALELAESLEQLRFMDHGIRIKMSETVAAELAIDTPEQADQVRAILEQREGGFASV